METQAPPWLPPAEDRWFCSEFCVAGLQRSGALAGLVPHRESPNSLFRRLHRGEIFPAFAG